MQSPHCALVALILATAASASLGDRSSSFQICVDGCLANICASSSTLPLALQITRWTCTDDCKYGCMHAITDQAIQQGDRIEQYFGKWPFWRFGGMQEPASVVFSLLNLWIYARGAREIRQKISDEHPMKTYYFIWSIISMNAWIWSSVFHTRG
jgi:post-GPI attachment to proteins factor 3